MSFDEKWYNCQMRCRDNEVPFCVPGYCQYFKRGGKIEARGRSHE